MMAETPGRPRHRPTPARLLCDWHNKGVPPGNRSPFYLAGCPRCEEKLAAGLVKATDPSPKFLYLAHIRARRRFPRGLGR